MEAVRNSIHQKAYSKCFELFSDDSKQASAYLKQFLFSR